MKKVSILMIVVLITTGCSSMYQPVQCKGEAFLINEPEQNNVITKDGSKK